MLANMKFTYKIWLLPALSAAALGCVLAAVALIGKSNTRALREIESGYYPSVELRGALQDDLTAAQRTLQDAVAAGDPDGLPAADSLAAAFRAALAPGRQNPVIPAAELQGIGARYDA